MKILLITDGIAPFVLGGMQKHSFFMAEYLARLGIEIEIHHFIDSGNEKEHEFSTEASQNITLVTHEFPNLFKFPGHYLVSTFLYSRLVYKVIKNRVGDFDFIYTKGFAGWELLRKKNVIEGIPQIGVKFHGMNMFLPTYGIKQRLEQLLLRPPTKWIMNKSDYVFSYGGMVTNTIQKVGIPIQKIIEIPTGISKDWLTTNFQPSTSTRKFVFVGRNDVVKGIRELNKALKYLEGDFEFHFVGPFEQKHRILKKEIIYHGTINNKAKLQILFDEMDVLVLPSYSEGMPNVILEAMARGCAILATAVGAVGVLVSKANGLLLRDSTSSTILNGLIYFSQVSNAELDQMKSSSIQIVSENFNWNRIGQRLKKELQRLSYA